MDIQSATKKCCRAMSKPTLRDWSKLKRLGRYVIGHKRVIHHYEFQDEVACCTTYSDANWASEKSDGKSTSDSLIMMGKHYVKSWARCNH